MEEYEGRRSEGFGLKERKKERKRMEMGGKTIKL